MSAEVKLIAVLLSTLALIAAFFGYGHYREAEGVRATTTTFETSIARQKAQAAAMLASETTKTRGIEQALQDLKNKQELQDADHQKTVAGLSARLRDLAGPAGRLRDPNAARCGCGGSGSPYQLPSAPCAGADNAAEASGLLSAQLTELLRVKFREADDINNAYASCRADAIAVRASP